MGYYTSFEILTSSNEVIDWMEENLDEFYYGERLEGDGYPPVVHSKWYSWKDDMLSVSAVFPEEFIEVRGTGEDRADVWLAIFKGGKVIYEKKFDWGMLD